MDSGLALRAPSATSAARLRENDDMKFMTFIF
jgi:hypothetical protein